MPIVLLLLCLGGRQLPGEVPHQHFNVATAKHRRELLVL